MFDNSIRKEKLFLVFGLMFGLLLVFLVPPIQAPDEDSHFKKAYLVSRLQLFPQVNNGEIGSFIAKDINDFIDEKKSMINNLSEKYSYSQYYLDYAVPRSFKDEVFVQYSTSQTNPILYIPQALFMTVCWGIMKILGLGNESVLSPLTYLQAGRLGSLAYYLICSYYALKNIPFFKNVLFLILIMPMSLFLGASLNYDALIIPTAALIISIIFKCAYDQSVKMISKKMIILFVLFAVILIEMKQVYYPLIFLLALIPKEKFKFSKWYTVCSIVVSGIISHLMWTTILRVATHSSIGNSNSHTSDQLFYILNNPFDFIGIIIRTSLQFKNFYLNSFFGNLGWLDTNFPVILVVIYLLVLAVVATFDNDNNLYIDISHKMYFLLIFLLIFVSIETALYITWTSIPSIGGVGNTIVEGVQGRYFIPFSLIVFILLYRNKPVSVNIKSAINSVVPTISLFYCIFTIFTIMIRYWV